MISSTTLDKHSKNVLQSDWFMKIKFDWLLAVVNHDWFMNRAFDWLLAVANHDWLIIASNDWLLILSVEPRCEYKLKFAW